MTPGITLSASAIFSANSSWVRAEVHLSLSFSRMTIRSPGFHRHGVGGNLRRADFGDHFLDFGKLLFENAACLQAFVHGVAQRGARERAHLHGKVPFRQLGNELAAQGTKQQQARPQTGPRR